MRKIFLTRLLQMYDLKPERDVTERYADVFVGQYVSDLVVLPPVAKQVQR